VDHDLVVGQTCLFGDPQSNLGYSIGAYAEKIAAYEYPTMSPALNREGSSVEVIAQLSRDAV
jgi:hypothetical protein